jgi:hypothetical protein
MYSTVAASNAPEAAQVAPSLKSLLVSHKRQTAVSLQAANAQMNAAMKPD